MTAAAAVQALQTAQSHTDDVLKERAVRLREYAERMRALLERAGIRVTSLKMLGRYVHINSYKKYDARLRTLLAPISIELHASEGVHMNGYVGYRMVATLS